MSPSLQVTRVQASPIRRLPAEVLCIVFDHVTFNDPFIGLITASHVSKSWRDAAVGSCLIWSDITIRLGLSSSQHLLASAFFERSGDVPINLTIQASRHFYTGEKEGLLQQHAHRIRSLNVRVNANERSASVANLLWMQLARGTNMPMRLEEFEILLSNSSYFIIKRKITTDSDENIIPPVSDGLVLWNNWRPTGLTELRLSTTLFNQPDLDEVYDALSATSATLHHFEYQGPIGSLDDEGVTTGRNHLEFPELRSLNVHCNDDMVPLLRFMVIPALDSLSIRDIITYPATTPAINSDVEETDVDFDPVGLFLLIRQWTSITNLEIYGLDLLPDDIPLPEILTYMKSLGQLSSLVLYGIGPGVATSMANTLFTHEEPLLPNLSRFLLGISEITLTTNNLCDYLISRRHHHLPRLQKLSINLDYYRHISISYRMGVLWESSDDVFVFANPDVNRFEVIPIRDSEVNLNLLEVQTM